MKIMEANQRLSGSKCAVNRRSLFAQNRKMLHVVILNLANRMQHVVLLANRKATARGGKLGTESLTRSSRLAHSRGMHRACEY